MFDLPSVYTGTMGRKPKVISDFDVRLGKVVRSKRTKAGLTRAEMADATGIAEANLKRREIGENEITVSELARIAAAVNVEPADIAEEALADYGGLRKLIDEHAPVSDRPISLEERRQHKMTIVTEDEVRKGRHAAIYDREHLEDDNTADEGNNLRDD